jgi:formylglycine-generating enzyme required for sulfatase activity
VVLGQLRELLGRREADPRGPSSEELRLSGGGSWSNDDSNVRVSYRYAKVPGGRFSYYGFRLARSRL